MNAIKNFAHECPEWDGLRITPDMPEWEACGCFVVSVVAQQPAAAVPDMAESLLRRAMDVCLEVVKGGKFAEHNAANLCNHIDAYLQQTTNAQALASNAGVPEVDDEDIAAAWKAFDARIGGNTMRGVLESYRTRLIESMNGGGE